mgnify:CR=1 FL=1
MSLGKASDPATPRDERVQLTPEGLKAYAHPLRMAILRYLHTHGAATSTTLAEHLGESTGQTSYHLRQLAKHGLIEDMPGRGTGRERWWRARAAGVDLTTMLTDEATAHAADTLLAEMLRDRTETLARWVGNLAHAVENQHVASRSLHSQATLKLTPDELGEAWHGDKLHPSESLFDPEVNIRVGADVLEEYLELADGDLDRALRKYSGNARGYANTIKKESLTLARIAERAASRATLARG